MAVPAAARLLLTPAGDRLLGRLAGQDLSPDRALALSESLRAEFPADLVAAALTQQALRNAASAKFSAAARMLFTRDGLEQASSGLTARHAAVRFAAARTVADLCCGIGGNLIALAAGDLASHPGRAAPSPPPAPPAPPPAPSSIAADTSQRHLLRSVPDHGRRVVGVDADPVSLAFARHNIAACAPGAHAAFLLADVTRLPLRGLDAMFIDPARRAGGRRLPAGQSSPALRWCLDLAAAVARVGIKAAPGLPRDLVPPGWEAEFVAVGRDLKEALLWSPALAAPGVASRATILPGGDTLTAGAAGGGPAPVAAPGAYLLDPSPAVTRAGLVADLAALLGAWQIDPMIAFLSAAQPVTTPFARTLRVLESAPWHEKRFARRLRELGVGSADIRRRGLAGDVAQIHRRLGLSGPGTATIVLTRMNDRPWGLICVPLPG